MEKEFKVRLEVVDPLGDLIKFNDLSLIIDDECEHERLYLYVGKCVYSIDKSGHIIGNITENYKGNF